MPGAREDTLSALQQVKSVTVGNVEYDLLSAKREETIGEMQSSKWVAYALHATILRFWELMKVLRSLTEQQIGTDEVNRKQTHWTSLLSSSATC